MAQRSPRGHLGPTTGARSLDRRILALAVPSLGALVAEPLFVLVDSAIIGHVGTPELAGLSLGGTVLTTLVGLCIFLAYATTASVARLTGAGHRRDAVRSAVDGAWLAVGLGTLLATAVWLAAPWLVDALGAPPDAVPHAIAYLRWSAPGLPGMLVVLATTGALRGLLDARTPMWVAAGGAVVNAVLSLTFVLGLGMGVAGSGLGTAITQIGMAAVLVGRVGALVRADGASAWPTRAGVLTGLRDGTPLFVRTLSLRAAIVLATWVAAGIGTVTLAGHQLVVAWWGLIAFALDALAIAAQALVGGALGAGDRDTARTVLRRTVRWGIGAGLVLGAVVGALAWWLPRLFTSDGDVVRVVTVTLLVVAVTLPLAGYVFVLDGVLIGAGDGRYLAVAGVATFLAYVPAALAVRTLADDAFGLAWSWVAFAGLFMLARAVANGVRARGTTWMRTGT